MDQSSIQPLVRDELRTFMSERCRLTQTNAAKDNRVLIYTALILAILLVLMFTWWLDWIPQNYWWVKLIVTGFLVVLLLWLGKTYFTTY